MKKAQVTIFIILAIIFVVLIGFVFVLKGMMKPKLKIIDETNPELFIKSCLKKDLTDSVNFMMLHGGVIKEENKAPGNISYLCFNENDECINNHPLLAREISKELKENLSFKINSCLEDFKKNLQKKAYEVQINSGEPEIQIVKNKIILNLNKTIIIKKQESVNNFNSIKINFKSSFYDLISISQEIVNSETLNCNFDFTNYVKYHPDYLIFLKVLSDSSKIYSIENKNTKEKMFIAIKGVCK